MGSDFSLETVLRFGSLPDIYTDERYRVDKLRAYVHTYLRQEIQQEALVKDLGSFHRFLQVAALLHGQVATPPSPGRRFSVSSKHWWTLSSGISCPPGSRRRR